MGILSDLKEEEVYLFFIPGYDECYLFEEKSIPFNSHHAFAKTLKRNVEEKCPDILDIVDFEYTKRMPAKVHSNHNKSFAGDFLPHEVLGKLLRTTDKNYYFCNVQRKEVIECIFNVHVFKYKHIKLDIEMTDKKLSSTPNNYWRINFETLFGLLEVEITDVVNYLEEYFFHPTWKKYDISLMAKLSEFGHNGDRQKKMNCTSHFNYFVQNKNKLGIRIRGDDEFKIYQLDQCQ